MKKRIVAALCALLLLCTLLPAAPTASAAGNEILYFMAINETVLDLTDETMPRMINGVLYVPHTMFAVNASAGGGLGLASIYSRTKGKLILYGDGKILEFDLNTDTAVFEDEPCQARAVIRNSVVFISLDTVCKLFGLEWSWIIMDRGYVIRVKNDEVVLSDREFADAATYVLEGRYQRYLQNKVTQENTGGTTGPTIPTQPVDPGPTSSPSGGNELKAEDAKVHLAFRMESGEGFDDILNQLKTIGTYGLFFCKPDELAARDDDVRTLLAAGHRVGLILDAESPEAQRDQFEKGNKLLSRIAHAETAVCLSEGLSRTEKKELEKSVCLWATTLNGTSKGKTQLKQVNAVVNGVSAGRSCFVLMDDNRQSARALTSITTQLMEAGAGFCLATEVTLQD